MTLTTSAEDYLKVVWNCHEWSNDPVTVTALAQRLNLSTSSVSEAVRKLTDRGLLAHAPYGDITLTATGQRQALTTVRKHRLLETYLVTHLGYTWDEVHDEAETLEHAVSDTFVERIATQLGNPTHDPHGDPIPTQDGTVPDENHCPLDQLRPGTTAHIARVRDHDPALLRHLHANGLTIGTTIRLLDHNPSAGTLTLEHDGRTTTLGTAIAHGIRTQTTAPRPPTTTPRTRHSTTS